MPTQGFEASLPFILRWEGGFVDNPADPGGRTNKGVTQNVYDKWRVRQGSAPRDVKQISEQEVRAIYEADYWFPSRCDLLQSKLDLVQFDTAVNMGVRRAVRLLQTSVGCGVDGDFGPNTLRAAQGCDLGAALIAYCNAREAFYRRLTQTNPKLEIFLLGWLNRLAALRHAVGVPEHESREMADRGATVYVAKVPEDSTYDF